jgi:hypothetical protein
MGHEVVHRVRIYLLGTQASDADVLQPVRQLVSPASELVEPVLR